MKDLSHANNQKVKAALAQAKEHGDVKWVRPLLEAYAGRSEDALREDMRDMFSNMMALGAGRAGALGVRSARRRPLGQAGTTGQFGREGLRIRSINI